MSKYVAMAELEAEFGLAPATLLKILAGRAGARKRLPGSCKKVYDRDVVEMLLEKRKDLRKTRRPRYGGCELFPPPKKCPHCHEAAPESGWAWPYEDRCGRKLVIVVVCNDCYDFFTGVRKCG